jgi:DNA-binding NtrC family response regulator
VSKKWTPGRKEILHFLKQSKTSLFLEKAEKMKNGSILIVDDNKSALSALSLLLQFDFETVSCLVNPNQIYAEFRKRVYDIVLLDMNFSAGINSGNEGLFWLSEIKKLAPATEVVMITAYAEVDLAVKALKQGATDFVTKPWQNEKLVDTLKAVLKLRHSNKEGESNKSREQVLMEKLAGEQELLTASSPLMKKVLQMVEKVAKTDASVLLTGENGTGKGLIASRIHQLSDRSSEALVTVDMGSVAEHLFESELFGHKKGAFTDAREDRTGKFQLAHKGSLFLDEIGNLPLHQQTKLLVALQSRMVIPVGANKPVPVDIRLISATNANIDEQVAEQEFREDLLYRLNTIRIELPPLRERGEDIEVLAGHFLKQYQLKYKKNTLRLSSPAIRKLMKYHWPGNIRELQHTMEKAVILSDADVLQPEDFIFKPLGTVPSSELQTLADMEKQMIEEALDKYSGNLSFIAEKLGISRQTLYNKLRRYEL